MNELNSIENELSQMSMNAMDFNNYEGIFKCIKKIEKRINQIKEKIDSKKQKELIDRQNKVDKLNKEKENVQYLLDKKIESMNLNNSKLIKKAESIISRNEFMSAGNSVKSISIGYNKEFYKDFNELTNEEKQKIKKYIKENARQFRTRISRNIKTDNKRKIDLPETCKKACSTNGIPINLCYKKPVRQKTRLVMFLDISGSCKEASEMMLYFMYCMKEVFPGGCKVYVFVNKLYDISKYFEIKDPDLAIKEVLSTIPTRGVYSDYGTPFKEFYENHFQELTNDSLLAMQEIIKMTLEKNI